jgi:hypothetical protein
LLADVPAFEPSENGTDSPRLDREGLGYVYTRPAQCIALHVDYLSPGREEVSAEITVRVALPGVREHLHQGRLRLDSTTQKRELVKYLSEIAPVVPIWREIVEECCSGVLHAVREGEPFVRTGRLPAREKEVPVIDPLLSAGKPTLVYGPGGNGKSYLAVACCVAVELGTHTLAGMAVQPGRALYVDWEDSRETLDERIKLVAKGLGRNDSVDIWYRPGRGTLRRQVHQHQSKETDDEPEPDPAHPARTPGVRLRAPVDAAAGAPPPGEHRAPVPAAPAGARPRLAADRRRGHR